MNTPDQSLLEKLRQKVGYIGINNPKINGPWVDTDKVVREIIFLFREEAKKCLPGRMKLYSPGDQANFSIYGFNAAISEAEQNIEKVFEGNNEKGT